MCSYRSVPASASHVLSFSVRDVVTLLIHVQLGKAKVDHKDFALVFSQTHDEILRLDVSMDHALLMNLPDVAYQLQSNHKDSIETHLLSTCLQQIFE